ncbi:MAG: hypothetical protein PVSMB4_17420 [Ktedonobacterales bacterium]
MHDILLTVAGGRQNITDRRPRSRWALGRVAPRGQSRAVRNVPGPAYALTRPTNTYEPALDPSAAV